MLTTSGGGDTITLPPVCTLAKNLEKSLEDNSFLHFSIENFAGHTSHLLKEELGFINSHTENILIIMDQIGRHFFF